MKITLLLILATLAMTVQGQQRSEWFLKNHPGNNSINPAELPAFKGFFAIPALGNHSYSVVSSPFTLNHMMTDNKLELNTAMMDKMAANAWANNIVVSEMEIPMIGFGFSAGKNFFSLTIKNSITSSVDFNKDVFALRYGLQEYWSLGQNRSFDARAAVDISAYNETALTFARPLGDKISIGVKLRMLHGFLSMKTNRMKMAIDQRPTSIHISPDIHFVSSFPGEIIEDENGNIESIEIDDVSFSNIFNSDNRGWAADFGITFKPLDRLTLGASVTDLGKLNWGNNIVSYTMNTNFEISESVIGSNDDYWDDLQEAMNENLKFKYDEPSYSMKMNTRLNLTAKYDLTQKLTLGGLGTAHNLPEGWKTTLSLGANFHPARWFEGALFYTMAYNTMDNVGLGVNFNFGAFNIFAATENIIAAVDYKNANYLSARAGINLLFGRSKAAQQTTSDNQD
jgi:hypothetical protein